LRASFLGGVVAAVLTSGPALAQADADPTPGKPPIARRSGTMTMGDLTRFNTSIVRIDTRIPEDATSAKGLGTARVGTGILLDDKTILTIGYLTVEADSVMVTTASGKRIPASVAGYDHATGFGLVRAAVPLDGTPMALGDSDKVT
jgi:S1-C subfamily serine protease